MVGYETESCVNPMNPSTTASTSKSRRLLTLIIGIMVFGLMMGCREEFEERWGRSLMAAAAGLVLGLSISNYRKTR